MKKTNKKTIATLCSATMMSCVGVSALHLAFNQNYAASDSFGLNEDLFDSKEEEVLSREEILAFEEAYKNAYVNVEAIKNIKRNSAIEVDAKEFGDIQGDKSDETAKIQFMLDYLNSNYPDKEITIKFPEGEYYTSKKITVHSNMTIIGEGDKTVFRNTKRRPVFINGIEGKMDYYLNAGTNITLKNVTFANSRVMSIGHSKGPILIENIKVVDQPNSHAIEICASKDVVIRNNVFEGLDRQDSHPDLLSRDYNEIIQIDSLKESAFQHFGSYNTNNASKDLFTSGVLIEGNTFKPSQKNAYPVAIGGHGSYEDVTGAFRDIKIKNNTFIGATKAAIRMPLTHDLQITGNTFKNMQNAIAYSTNSKTVETDGITINKNTFSGVAKSISLARDVEAKTIKNVSVSDNSIVGAGASLDSGYGIYVDSSIEGFKVENNTFKNTVYGLAFNTNSDVNHSDDIFIEDNKYTNVFKAIRLARRDGAKPILKASIKNNSISGTSSNISRGKGYGVYIDSSLKDLKIESNKINSLVQGISFNSNSSMVTDSISIKNNEISDVHKSIRIYRKPEGSYIKSIKIQGNDINGSAANLKEESSYGVYVNTTVDDLTISKNNIKNTTLAMSFNTKGNNDVKEINIENNRLINIHRGIRLYEDESGKRIEKIIIKNNEIEGIGEDLKSGSGDYGVYINSAKHAKVTNMNYKNLKKQSSIKVDGQKKVVVYGKELKNENVVDKNQSTDTNKEPQKDSGTVTTNDLNLRTGAGIKNKSIAKLNKGTKLEVAGSKGEWLRVKVESTGRTGYVHNAYVNVKYSEDKKQSGTVTTNDLNLRTGANVKNKSIAKLKKGTELSIIGKQGKWLRVNVKGSDKSGYVHRAYVKRK